MEDEEQAPTPPYGKYDGMLSKEKIWLIVKDKDKRIASLEAQLKSKESLIIAGDYEKEKLIAQLAEEQKRHREDNDWGTKRNNALFEQLAEAKKARSEEFMKFLDGLWETEAKDEIIRQYEATHSEPARKEDR